MRILQLNDAIGGKVGTRRSGGVEGVVESLCGGLVDRGHAVDILAARDTRGAAEEIDVEGARAFCARTFGFVGPVPLAPGALLRLGRVARDYDVVHLHIPSPFLEFAVAVYGGRVYDRLVVTVHADARRSQYAYARLVIETLLRRNLPRARKLVCTAPGNEINLDGRVEHDDYQVVPIGIEPSRFAEQATQPDESFELPETFVFFVGRLVYYKGVDVLVRSMQYLDASLLIAGEGPLRSELQRLASEVGVDDRVVFLGYVSDAQLGQLYRQASVFVLPSIVESEAFGLVQVEAMIHGCPVVNTDLESGVPWVSQNGATGLTVPPGDAVALARAIEDIVSDPTIRRHYSDRARERASVFDTEQMIDDYESVYQSICGKL